MQRYQVTITHTVTLEAVSETAIREAFDAVPQGEAIEREILVQELLSVPERRVVIHEDELGYQHGDYEDEGDREEVERRIEQNGVYGFECQERTIVDGPWECTDSIWGFIGGRSMLRDMREYMPEEFRKIEPIDAYEAQEN